jgi:hypothetical protein
MGNISFNGGPPQKVDLLNGLATISYKKKDRLAKVKDWLPPSPKSFKAQKNTKSFPRPIPYGKDEEGYDPETCLIDLSKVTLRTHTPKSKYSLPVNDDLDIHFNRCESITYIEVSVDDNPISSHCVSHTGFKVSLKDISNVFKSGFPFLPSKTIYNITLYSCLAHEGAVCMQFTVK